VTRPSTTGAGTGVSESAFVEEDSPAAAAAATTGGAAAGATTGGQNQQPVLPPAPTPAQATQQFPAYVGGKPTTHVLVPIGAIKENEVKITTEKGEMAVRVPVTSHFSTFVHPMMDTLGREAEESWGRSGKIKFQFDRNWIGAKGEAEVLQHNILQACENRRNAQQSETLNLGGGGAAGTTTTGGAGGWANPATTTTAGGGGLAGGGGGGGTTTTTTTTQPLGAVHGGQQRVGDVDPLDTSSEAKVAGVST
jgi:hypothetical protein